MKLSHVLRVRQSHSRGSPGWYLLVREDLYKQIRPIFAKYTTMRFPKEEWVWCHCGVKEHAMALKELVGLKHADLIPQRVTVPCRDILAITIHQLERKEL